MSGLDTMLAGCLSREPIARLRGRWLSCSLTLGASIVCHLLLIGTLIALGGQAKHPERSEGLGANSIASTDEAVATLILIEDPSSGAEEVQRESVASHGVVLQNFRLTIVSPIPTIDVGADSEADPNEAVAPVDDTSSDREVRAALFGQYIGQIQARVERAWLRPRSAIGEDLFECRVQILQNPRGEVEEVTLQRCNGDSRWQLSLVQAIERASPLPAPPEPTVFSGSIQLVFRSELYEPGADTGGYESGPAARSAADNFRTTNIAQGH
jgi:hypothetical protein